MTDVGQAPDQARTISKELCWKVKTSFGVMNQVLPFLAEFECNSCQLCDKFFYNVAIGRS